MRGVIPASAPPHVCLLVAVSHPQDRAGTACDPVGDRHWAQRNLTAVPVAPGAPALQPMLVANPFDREAEFLLRVRQADGERAERVALEVGTVPADGGMTIRLLDSDGGEVGEGGHVQVALGPRDEVRVSVLVEVDAEIEAGSSLALEAELIDEAGERVVGALGMALVGSVG